MDRLYAANIGTRSGETHSRQTGTDTQTAVGRALAVPDQNILTILSAFDPVCRNQISTLPKLAPSVQLASLI